MTDLLDSPVDPPPVDPPLDPLGATDDRQAGTVRAPGAGVVRPMARRRPPSTPPVLDLWRSRTLVLAPHPGDETITVGGLIARQRSRGHDVTVVAVTDGRSAASGPHGSSSPRRDQLEALERLGVARGDIHRPVLPVGAVAEHVDELVALLDELVRPDDVLVAPSALDQDPDHHACHLGARRVAERTGCRVLGSVSDAASVDTEPASAVAVVLVMSDEDVERRDRALACHEQLSDCIGPATAGRSPGASGDHPVERYVTVAPPVVAVARPAV